MDSPEIDWGNAEIVDKEQEYYKRCFFGLKHWHDNKYEGIFCLLVTMLWYLLLFTLMVVIA